MQTAERQAESCARKRNEIIESGRAARLVVSAFLASRIWGIHGSCGG